MADTLTPEPVNLLACDGGGIRGVSELVILDEVMKKVQERGNLASVPKPCDYFHLLAGTSTGGLVAIMLGRLEMSTEQALAAYDAFASDIFSKKNKNRFNPTEKYRAKALEKSVQRLVQDHGKGSLLRDSRPHYAKGRAFICTMPLEDRNTTVRLRTYDVNHDKYSNCLIYEAARATTAASTFFRPMTLKDDQGNKQKCVDAALGRNNPVTLLPEEAISLYGTRRRLGCVVSLGTGSRKAELVQAGKGILAKGKQIVSVLKVMKEISTDTRRDHESMVKMFKDFPGVYFRFDVDGGAEGISLDQWEKIDQLKERTRAYLQRPEVKTSIEDLAEALISGNPHGLNLGHLGGLDRDIVIRETQVAKPRGMASTIFTGRESILKKLRTFFVRGDSDDGLRKHFHLWGMGGVGKTQIALKFSEECERESLQILWIDATDLVTIQQSYLRIAQKLLPADQQGPEAVQKILGMLEASDKWLLVFDNAPDSGLAHYTPDGNRGNIIYTSRQKKLERRIHPDHRINVNEMEIGDATTLLLRSARMATENVDNRDIARRIAKELGYLPLALDQAGAYIHMDKCPIENFLEKFEEQKESLLKNPKCRGEDNLRNLPVYATFNISYEAIKAFADKRRDIERAPEATYALQLLQLLCFYHNEGFMMTMFYCAAMTSYLEKRSVNSPLQAEGVSLDHFVQDLHRRKGEEHDFEWQSQCFDLGIGFLEEFSLIRYDYAMMYSNMHILVHDWARGRMSKSQRAEWGLAARRIVIDALPQAESREAIMHRREMLPHVDACMKFVGGDDHDPKLESQYLYKIATLYDEADRPEAETAYLKALKVTARGLGYLDELTLASMLGAAIYYDDHDRDTEAEALYLETVDRMVIREDEKRWRAAHEKQMQKPESKSQQESANHRQAEALDSSELRNAKGMLATFYHKLGRVDAAEKHTGDIIAWSRRFSTTDTGDKREDDEQVFRARGLEAQIAGRDPLLLNLPEAKRLYLEAKEAHGQEHHETIWRQSILARCLVDKEEFKEAEDHLFMLSSWYKETHGADSKEAMDALVSMANCFREQSRPWESVWLVCKVQRKYHDKFGPTHDKTMDCALNLADSYFLAGMFELAIGLVADILEVRGGTLGPEHPRTRHTAYLLRKYRSTAATIPLFERVRWVQQVLYNTKVVLERDGAYMPAPPWLTEWKPVPIEPMLTADGAKVRYVQDLVEVEEGTVLRWRALDEAAFVPDQKLADVLPPILARFLREYPHVSNAPRVRAPRRKVGELLL